MPTANRNFRTADSRWSLVLERAEAERTNDDGSKRTATDVIAAALDAYLLTPITSPAPKPN